MRVMQLPGMQYHPAYCCLVKYARDAAPRVCSIIRHTVDWLSMRVMQLPGMQYHLEYYCLVKYARDAAPRYAISSGILLFGEVRA